MTRNGKGSSSQGSYVQSPGSNPAKMSINGGLAQIKEVFVDKRETDALRMEISR